MESQFTIEAYRSGSGVRRKEAAHSLWRGQRHPLWSPAEGEGSVGFVGDFLRESGWCCAKSEVGTGLSGN